MQPEPPPGQTSSTKSAAVPACPDCGRTLTAAMLVCPHCAKLVHAEELKRLVAAAEVAQAASDPATALSHYRAALPLLPVTSRQHALLLQRIAGLSTQVAAGADGATTPTTTGPDRGEVPAWIKRLGPLGAVALLLWKFKFVLVALASHAKFLLLGLTKASTLFSMLLSMAAYLTLYGWRFAVGLIASIYVHEMGHVAALRRFGMPATAPMFIPGVGALVRLQSQPVTVAENARVGLAGPIWGLGAALACYVLGQLTGGPTSSFSAIARAGAWLNLFNLMPVWQLDGARGFTALSRRHRFLVTAAFATAWALTGEGLLALISLIALTVSFRRDAPEQSDPPIVVRFFLLIAALTYLTTIKVKV